MTSNGAESSIDAPFFNLVDEPWVLVLDQDGQQQELSLSETFHRADEMLALSGDIATQTFAILRVLLAVLHRAVYGPEDVPRGTDNPADWRQTLKQVDEYLDAFHDRFWMQHPTQPFMQVADLATSAVADNDLSRIICDGPGASTFLTTRLGQSLTTIPWAQAARWLIHTQAYDISGIHTGAVGDPRVKGGRGYGIGTGWVGQIGGVYAEGDSLRDTLLLNLIAPCGANLDGGPDDLPIWERPALTQLPQGWLPGSADQPYRQPTGPVDVFTWASRRLRLSGTQWHATAVINAQGDRLTPQNRFQVEPFTAWRYSEPQTKKLGATAYMPLKHEPGRAFWRGLGSLLPQTQQMGPQDKPVLRRPPAIIQWLSDRQFEGGLPQGLIKLRSVGMAYGNMEAVYSELVTDELVLPAVILDPSAVDLHDTVRQAVNCADKAVFAVVKLAENIAQAAGADPLLDGSADKARAAAYAVLDQSFRRWIRSIRASSSIADLRMAWHCEVRHQLEALGSEMTDAAGPPALVGRIVAKRHIDAGLAMAWFRKQLRDAVPNAFMLVEDQTKEEEQP